MILETKSKIKYESARRRKPIKRHNTLHHLGAQDLVVLFFLFSSL